MRTLVIVAVILFSGCAVSKDYRPLAAAVLAHYVALPDTPTTIEQPGVDASAGGEEQKEAPHHETGGSFPETTACPQED